MGSSPVVNSTVMTLLMLLTINNCHGNGTNMF